VGGPKAGYMYRWWSGTLITIVKALHEHQNPTITYCAAFWSLSISVTVPSCSFWSKTSYPAGGTLFPLITTITKVHEDEGLKNNLTDIRISEYDVFTNSSSAFWKWRSSRINGWMGLAEDVYINLYYSIEINLKSLTSSSRSIPFSLSKNVDSVITYIWALVSLKARCPGAEGVMPLLLIIAWHVNINPQNRRHMHQETYQLFNRRIKCSGNTQVDPSL
jgi:hypothetical protein